MHVLERQHNRKTIIHADGLSVGFRKPCIVFAGHPSLRFGDAVHFVKMWRNSASNSFIFVGKFSQSRYYLSV